MQEKCKCSAGAEHKTGKHVGGSALEAVKLALWQRLGQLEHPRHVLAVVCEIVIFQAVRQGHRAGADGVKVFIGR